MRHGITIQERACPWCHNRRTVRFANGPSICFNCGHRWSGQSAFEHGVSVMEPRHPVEAFDFGPVATARLEVYRRAVRAGYYNEWPPA